MKMCEAPESGYVPRRRVGVSKEDLRGLLHAARLFRLLCFPLSSFFFNSLPHHLVVGPGASLIDLICVEETAKREQRVALMFSPRCSHL